MRSARRSSEVCTGAGNSGHMPTADVAERVGGWPARSAVLSSPNQGNQGGSYPPTPESRPALTFTLGVFVGVIFWTIVAMAYKFWRLAQY